MYDIETAAQTHAAMPNPGLVDALPIGTCSAARREQPALTKTG
jgi:hypothetical protein